MAPDLSKTNEKNFLIFIILSVILPSFQQTTDQVSTANVFTDSPIPTITPEPPIDVTTQGQTVVPTDASELPQNTDLGPCICDLTTNGCDVNCCCDSDCTADDRNTFSQCIEDQNIVDNKLCFQSGIIFLENTPETVDTTDPSLFCIVTDNYKDRNYYTIPQTVDTVERFEELTDLYGDTSYAVSSYQNETYQDFYKSGDAVYTIYDSLSLGVLGLPSAVLNSECQDGNPAAYLFNEDTQCIRKFTNLADQCATEPAISALSYYKGFKVVSTPSFLQQNPIPDPRLVNATDVPTTQPAVTLDPTATTAPPIVTTNLPEGSFYDSVELLDITIRDPVMCETAYGLATPCDFDGSNVPIPVLNATTGMCDFIVKKVHYHIAHNGTDGIMDVEVELVLGSLTYEDPLFLTQSFATSYTKRRVKKMILANNMTDFGRAIYTYHVSPTKFDEVDVVELSGNPGYVIGAPLLAGNLVELTQPDGTIKKSIQLGNDRNNWLTIVKSTADGTCVTDADSRTSVTFGEDVRSGCMIRVSYENVSDICEFIQESALNALTGQMPEYVGMFGNSKVEIVGDWVPIIVDELIGSPTSPSPGTCDNMVMALHVEILYANVGSLANPQAKLLGVRYNYAEGKTLRYHCSGSYCQAGAASLIQNFEVASSVGFVETSTYPEAVIAERPKFDAKLPNDFFYPFSFSSTTRLHLDVRLLFTLLCVYFLVFMKRTL